VSGTRIPTKDWRQHLAETTGTWVRIGNDPPKPPRDTSRYRTPPSFTIPSAHTFKRAIVLAVVLIVLISTIRGLLREGNGFTPYPVPTSLVTDENPWVCGVEGQPVSAEVWGPSINGSATTYQVQCASGETVYDSES
jgi:hypothetical protein